VKSAVVSHSARSGHRLGGQPVLTCGGTIGASLPAEDQGIVISFLDGDS
jgi:hypothetical protein